MVCAVVLWFGEFGDDGGLEVDVLVGEAAWYVEWRCTVVVVEVVVIMVVEPFQVGW